MCRFRLGLVKNIPQDRKDYTKEVFQEEIKGESKEEVEPEDEPKGKINQNNNKVT